MVAGAPLVEKDRLGGSQPSGMTFLSREGSAVPSRGWSPGGEAQASTAHEHPVRTPTAPGTSPPQARNPPAFHSSAIAPGGKSGGSGGQNTNVAATAVRHRAYGQTGESWPVTQPDPAFITRSGSGKDRGTAPPSPRVTV